MKKVLSFALAIVMLLSCFTAAFAAVDNAACKIAIVPKETSSYKNGDTVTFLVNFETDPSLLGNIGAVLDMYIGFNGDAFEYIEDISSAPTFDKCQTVNTVGYPVANNIEPTISYVDDFSADTLTTADTAKGWNKVLRVSMAPVIPKNWDDNYSAGATCFEFKLKVKDAAAAGTYTLGIVQNNKTTIDEELGSFSEDPELAGMFGVASVLQLVDANVTVGSPAPASILKPLKSQIRFDKNADNTYAGTFAVRQLAVVSKADFENAFGTTVEAQKAAIAEVGYVFARTSTVATFDVAAAKALIENGTAAAGYTKLTVDYITTKADLVGEGNYGFSCIVANIPTADKADGINALAYIKGTDGTYHYYPAAEPTSFNDLYTAHYNSAFPA